MPNTLAGMMYLPYDLVYWSRLEAVSAAEGGFAHMTNRNAVRAIVPRPLLLIAAGAEPSGFETSVNQALFAAAEAVSPGATTYWVIDDVYHGGGFSTYPEIYTQRLLTFFDDALQP